MLIINLKFCIMSNVKSKVGTSIFFLASARAFNGSTDKNGKAPLVLSPISGQSPRGLNVMSGTSAEVTGFEVGKVYAVKATEREPYTDDSGNTTRGWNFEPLGVVSAMEAMAEAQKNNGISFVIDPNTDESSERTHVDADEAVEATA